jgi:hypothetical protein
MRVVKKAEIIGFRRICRAHLPRFHFQLSLAETSSFNENVVCEGQHCRRLLSRARLRWGRLTWRRIVLHQLRVTLLRKVAVGHGAQW